MTPEELIAKIEQEEGQAYGINDSQLTGERAEALNLYVGGKLGTEVEGRSQVVSYDVQDTIETALPQLIKIFVSGDEVVRFDPKGREDEPGAKQETEYINHVVMEKNNGYAIFYTWIKDALLSKNGYVKVWYEEEENCETESYRGLSDEQLSMIVNDSGVEVLEHTEYPDPMAQSLINQHMQQQQAMGGPMMVQPQVPNLHDVKIKCTKNYGCIKIDNVAPEAIMVSVDTKTVSLQNARFVQHREQMSRADIEANGWEVPEGAAEETDRFMEESSNRDLYSESNYEEQNGYLVKDTYYRIDGELKRYVVIGNKIVHEEEAEIIPFACITPMVMPHRHIGRSYSDLTKDIQVIKSTMLRGQLDNMYLSNNGRYAISDRVNLEDMLTSRPGGVVRVQGGDLAGALMPLSHTPFPPTSFSMIEYLDAMKEKRTGVMAQSQVLDANSLHKTATGVQLLMTASQARLELVARTIAETGVKELFMLVHRLVRKYYTKPDIVRLRNEWVEVDPREWKDRKDMTVSVGLGTGNKDQQLAHIVTILQAQKEAIQIGVATPSNIYNALVKLTQNAGFKNPEEFWTDPAKAPPQEPRPDPEMIKAQGQMQVEQMKIQAEQDRVRFQSEADAQKAQMQLQHEQVRSQNDVAIEQAKIQAQMELERWKAQLAAETTLQKVQLELQAKKEIEAMKAQNDAAMQMKQHSVELSGILEKAKGSQGADQSNAVMQGLQAVIQSLNSPKQIVRDENGRAVGVAPA